MNNLPPDPTITPTQTNYAFRYFCQKVLPTVYDESLSYYELLCKLTGKINEVIESSNKNGEAITELQNLYLQLKSYVDDYFKNLDLQPEIDEALNRMAESGDLATLISQYLNGINVYGFRTINDMKNAETIGIGSICRTLGDTDYKTGNGKFYYVRQYLTTDTIDDDNIIALINNPQAVAEKIPDYFYNTITSNIGYLSNLTTTDKTSTVGAINEVKGLSDTNTTNIGDLSNLATTEKSSTVGAINELKTETVPINRGGTNATTSENACINLGLGSSATSDFSANDYNSWGAHALNYVDNNITDRRPFVFHAGWQSVGFGSGIAFKTSSDYKFAMLNNQNGGVSFWGKDSTHNVWGEMGILGHTLYDNSSGTTGTITLSESAANFNSIDIIYNNNCTSRVYSPNNKNVALFDMGADVYSTIYFNQNTINISGNTITVTGNLMAYASNGTTMTTQQSNTINIKKIIGYK